MQLLLLLLKNHRHHHRHHQQNQSLLTRKNHHHQPEEKKEENNVEEKMNTSVNVKRRRDCGDILKNHHNPKFKHPPSNNPRKKNDEITSSTPATCPKHSSSTKIKKYASPSHWFHSFPNTTFPLTNLNGQIIFTAPFGGQRLHTTSKITHSNQTSCKMNIKWSSTRSKQFPFLSRHFNPPNIDHTLKKTLEPLKSLRTIHNKDITNPYLFRGVAMVTNFVLSPGNRTNELWQFIEEASRTDIALAEMEHSSNKDLLCKCKDRVPIYVLPCFYRSLNLRYPFNVGGISRDGRDSTELCTGSLRQAVGILTPRDFRPVVSSE